MWLASLVAAIGVATVPYYFIRAEESATVAADTTASVQAQENVVVSPTDKPLERKQKLERNWVLYNDGTTVWALYKGTSAITCVTTPCPATAEHSITKRAIQTMSFFTAFKANFRIVLVGADRLSRITTGDPITSVDGLTADMFIKRPYNAYRLVKAQGSPAVYLDDGSQLKPVVSEKVFKNLGLDFKDVETVAASWLSQKPVTSAVTADTVFSEDVAVQSTAIRKTLDDVKSRLGPDMLKKIKDAAIKVGERYFLMTKNGKRPIPPAQEHQVSERLNLDLSKAVEVTAEEAAAIPTVAEVTPATPVAEVNTSAQ
jgi:hypothetical protein